MKVKDYSEFVIDCNNGYCNRGTLYNEKTCITETKQKPCYPKYITKLEKQKQKFINACLKNNEKYQEAIDNNFIDSIDEKWELVKEQVWKRDCSLYFTGFYQYVNWQDICVIWNFILSQEEKKYLMQNYIEEMSSCYYIDNLHIESRQRRPDLIYDIDNVILASRFFHSRFDNYKDLVTGKSIKEIDRNMWAERFKKYVEEKKK